MKLSFVYAPVHQSTESCLMPASKIFFVVSSRYLTVTRFYKDDRDWLRSGCGQKKSVLELTVRKSQGANARRNERKRNVLFKDAIFARLIARPIKAGIQTPGPCF